MKVLSRYISRRIDIVSLIALALSSCAASMQYYGDHLRQVLVLHEPHYPVITFYPGVDEKKWVSLLLDVSLSNLSENAGDITILRGEVDLSLPDQTGAQNRIRLYWQHFVTVDDSRVPKGQLPRFDGALPDDAAPFVVPGPSTATKTIWFAPRSGDCGTNCLGSHVTFEEYLEPRVEAATSIDLSLTTFSRRGLIAGEELSTGARYPQQAQDLGQVQATNRRAKE